MATAEELIAKYKQDRKEKLLKLQGIFSSQINQEIKRYSKIQKQDPERGLVDSSYISAFYTANDLYPTDELMWNFMNLSLGTQAGKIRTDFQNKLSVKGEPFSYLQVVGSISLPTELSGEYVNPETVTIQPIIVNIFEKSLLKLPDDTNPSIVESPSSPGYDTLKVESYTDLSKKLSGFSYPIRYIGENQGFFSHIERINEKLEDTKFLSVDSIPVITYAYFELPDGTEAGGVKGKFNRIFPKPEGWDSLFGTTQGADTSGVSGVNGAVGTSGVSGVTDGAGATGVSGVTDASGVTNPTGTSGNVTNQPTDSGQTNTTPQNGTSGNNRKYLSIESVKDDEITIRSENTGSSNYLSTVFLEDDPVIEDYYSESQIKQIQTEKVNSQSKDKVQPGNEVNKEVVNKEIEQKKQQTESQRKSEEADSLEKKDVKEKSNGTPDGSNPDIPEGKSAKIEEKKDQIPDKKPEDPVKTSGLPQAPPFLEWKNGAGFDPNGIIYRGKSDSKYKTGEQTKIPITTGLVEKRFKNLFEYGSQVKKFFSGISLESPIDVTLAMNCIQSGQFNKNVPYLFGEGSEIHLLMISGVIRESEGGIGTYGNNANWGAEPFWCGFFTNFVLGGNGIYKSDPSVKNITGTSSVLSYYVDSPYNITKGYFELAKKDLEKDIADLKNGNRKDSLVSLNKELANKKQRLDRAYKAKEDALEKSGPTGIKPQINTNIVAAEREYDNVKSKLDKTNSTILSKQKELDAVNRNTSSFKEYNEENTVALFEPGIHFAADGTLTAKGKELWDKIKNWPGAYAVRDGHVEVLLHFKQSGKFYTIGGNTGISSTLNSRSNPAADAGEKDRNGYQLGFKCAGTAGGWAGGGKLYLVKRGSSKPYTNGIGISVKRTKSYDEYAKKVKDKSDKTITGEAYNILKDIVA
jgi:hypothetical protein